jgi:hypothetical protein
LISGTEYLPFEYSSLRNWSGAFDNCVFLVSAHFEYRPEERYLKHANFDDLIDPWP